ncbi:hypothetical protein Dda_3441 [Drechslerella dactyloides]|uniref:Uncharacterized protein n=1 Tax=Drechslerella dactyloides TaxID=74499 RepID=A0AAD6NL81_DREDA|nr:hypothetical protein Dda_3441 [Drechslerella dactyloides]
MDTPFEKERAANGQAEKSRVSMQQLAAVAVRRRRRRQGRPSFDTLDDGAQQTRKRANVD